MPKDKTKTIAYEWDESLQFQPREFVFAHPMYAAYVLNRPGANRIETTCLRTALPRGGHTPGTDSLHTRTAPRWMVIQAQDRWMLRPWRTAASFSAAIFVCAAYTLKSTQSSCFCPALARSPSIGY